MHARDLRLLRAGQKQLFLKVISDRFRLRTGYDRRQSRRIGLSDRLHAAKVF